MISNSKTLPNGNYIVFFPNNARVKLYNSLGVLLEASDTKPYYEGQFDVIYEHYKDWKLNFKR